jgi:gliding motility-associated-like protein
MVSFNIIHTFAAGFYMQMHKKPVIFTGLLLLLYFNSPGQFTCTVAPGDTVVCPGSSITFTAAVTGGTGPFSYQWQKNSADLFGETDSLYSIPLAAASDTAYYRCIAWAGSDRDTSNASHLGMFPELFIDTLYRTNSLGCPGDCKGQFKVHVSGGGLPYIYDWNAGFSQDTMVFGVCPGAHIFEVTDANGCKLAKDYFVEVLRLPEVEFTAKPRDTIYLSNPTITVSFPDTSEALMTNWEWDFGDTATLANLNPAQHIYQRTGAFNISLTFTDLNSCDTTIQHTIYVKIAELKIPNVFTPNGDGKNDQFMIQIAGNAEADYRDAYLGTELIIFDRWGKKVFQKNNYPSAEWDGGNLANGVYFYILKCQGQFGDEVFKGSVTIMGNNFSGGE